jgi:lysine 6-dehydrogenase
MGKKILLVGLGMQGTSALYDLLKCDAVSSIVVADSRPDLQTHLKRFSSQKVRGTLLDASDEASLSHLMHDADLVVEALPGSFALPVGRLAAECGVSLVSSMYYLNPGEEDREKVESMKRQIREIDRTAKEKGITILSEFGLDPGIDLVLATTAIHDVGKVEELSMYGAGFPGPKVATNPLQYKFSWSTLGVMKSYHRPAKIISNGQAITIDATRVFEPGIYHMLSVEGIGSPLECFPNGDSMHYAELFGIRNSVQEMGRYTCRFPGHCAFWDIAVKCGFLDEGSLRVGAVTVTPLEFTTALLSSKKQFRYAEDEEDVVLLRVDARGTRDGKRTRIVYQLIDTRDFETGFTAMQRTVGFTLSLGARLILEGKLNKQGLLTPLDVPYELVIPDLARHNIRVTREEIPWR